MNFKTKTTADNLEREMKILSSKYTLENWLFGGLRSTKEIVEGFVGKKYSCVIYIKENENLFYPYADNVYEYVSLELKEGTKDFIEAKLIKIPLSQIKIKRVEEDLIMPDNIIVHNENNVLSFYEIQMES